MLRPSVPKAAFGHQCRSIRHRKSGGCSLPAGLNGLSDPPASAAGGGMVSWQVAGNFCSLQELTSSPRDRQDTESRFFASILHVQYS